ncbi:MAG: hypothetical protein ACRDAI_05505 [Candidatus Rhabdochlamydia sp.]
MTISQNYSNCLYNSIQDTTSHVEQEQPSTNVNTPFLDFKYLFNLMNEEDSAFFEGQETNPTLLNQNSFSYEETLLQELQNHQFEQETLTINNNRESRQCEERSCKTPKNQRRIKAPVRKISPERIQQMTNEKEHGASIRSIIEKYKVHRNTLHRHGVFDKKYSFGFLLNLEEKLRKFFLVQPNHLVPREQFEKIPPIPATILSSCFSNGTFHCFNREAELPQNSLELLNNQLTKFLAKKKFEIIDQRTQRKSIKIICKNFKTSSTTLYKHDILQRKNKHLSAENTCQTPDKKKLPGIETLKEFMNPVYNLRPSTLNQKLYYKI